MEVKAEIKRCSHCGRKAAVKERWTNLPPWKMRQYYGYCERCHLAGEPSICKDFAVYNWNEKLAENVR